jgi:BlaI family transcriptional regulator, penicillinase repressor
MSAKPNQPPRPTDAELEILTVLWSLGPSTVRDVHETIVRRKPAQYTTVLKTLQIMAEKGLVERNEKQRAHIYSAARPREWTRQQLAGDLLQRAFGGLAASLMLGALSAHKASPDELAELKRYLEDYEKGNL